MKTWPVKTSRKPNRGIYQADEAVMLLSDFAACLTVQHPSFKFWAYKS